jgi:HK97 family phage major capsid protein
MSLLLKTLNEQRGAKLQEAQSIREKVEAEKRGLTDTERETLKGINDSVDKYNADITEEARSIANASARAPQLSTQESRDVARFDIATVLRQMHNEARGVSGGRKLEGIELEMIQEGDKEARAAGIESGGIFLPRMLVRRESRDMTASGQTSTAGDQGGMTIATEKRGLLDDFFDASVMRQAGATVLEGLVGNVDIPRLTAGTAPAGKTENANADEVSPLTAMLSLTPQRLPAYIDLSERLLKQSSVSLEAIIRSHLTNQMLAVQERAFFHGDGSDEAEGIAGTAGIGSVAGGTNGLAPTWAHLVNLRKAVQIANALQGNVGYITNGDIEAKLAVTSKVASTDSVMILNEFGSRLAGSNLWITNAVRSDLVKGSSGATCSAIFFGNFSDYYIGYWGGISLELVRDKANAIAGLYTLVANAYYDGGVARPKSFSAMLDALGD